MYIKIITFSIVIAILSAFTVPNDNGKVIKVNEFKK
jgi:hypothetical protein